MSPLVSELNGAVLDDPDYYGDELPVGTEEEVRNRLAQAPRQSGVPLNLVDKESI